MGTIVDKFTFIFVAVATQINKRVFRYSEVHLVTK